jgi:hypothetical protein
MLEQIVAVIAGLFGAPVFLLLLVFIVTGGLVALPLYCMAFWGGPAIRRMGRRWQEGVQQAMNDESQVRYNEYMRGIDDGASGRVRRVGQMQPTPKPDAGTSAPTPQKFSITGRRLP